MPTLIIQDDDESELLRVQIKRVDPSAATVAILGALKALEPEKKTRADKGTKRQPTLLPKKANSTGAPEAPADPAP